MSKDVAPHAVLTLLNQLFTHFDALCDVHGVQKVRAAPIAPMQRVHPRGRKGRGGHRLTFDNCTLAVAQVDTAGDSYIVACGVLEVDSEGFYQVGSRQDPAESAHRVMAFAQDMLLCAKEVGPISHIWCRSFITNPLQNRLPLIFS